MKKLNLKKDVVSVLENETLRLIYAGNGGDGGEEVKSYGVTCGNCTFTSCLCGTLGTLNICTIESGDDDSKVYDDCPDPQTDRCHDSIVEFCGIEDPGDDPTDDLNGIL